MTSAISDKRRAGLRSTTTRLTAAMVALALAAGSPAVAKQATPEAAGYAPARTFSGAFLAGEAARSDSDFFAAALYFNEALYHDPDNEALQRELLLALLGSGQFGDAIPVAEKLRDAGDIERIAKVVLGIDAIRSNDFQGAQEVLQLSSRNELETLLTGVMRAWAIHGGGDTDNAVAELDGLQGPDWYRLFTDYHRALISADAGNLELAGTSFDDAINNATGGNASPFTYLRIANAHARFLVQQGDTTGALASVDRGLALVPTNPILLSLRDDIRAENVGDPLVDTVSEGAAEILLNLGSAINRDGAEAFATLYLEMARALTPTEASVLFELGAIAERMDLPARAIEYYENVPDDSPIKRLADLQRGLNLSDMDRYDEAVETLRGMVDENPDDYRGYLALGGVYSSKEDYANSALVYETALEHIDNDDPTFWPLHYRLGISLERTKQWPKAEARFKKTLELSPDEPDVMNYLGYSWIDMNMNLEEGLELIRKAVELRPNSGYIVDSLGWAYYRMGRFEEAVIELERAADLLPADPTINDHLGDAYWRVGRKLEATYQWSTSLAFDPDEELKTRIMVKLAQANTKGVEPEIAKSIADDDADTLEASTDPAEAGSAADNDG